MLNPSVQVSINQTGYLPNKKKWDRHLGDYSSWKKPRNLDRHKLNFKTRHWVRFLKSENYLLTSLDNILKLTLSGGCRFDKNGGCRFSYISISISNKNLFFLKDYPAPPPYLIKQKDYLFSHLIWREKEILDNLLAKRPYQFKKKWEEIKLKAEILSKWDNPAKLVPGYRDNGRPKPTWEGVGWNLDDYWEVKNRSLAALAFTHEIVLGKVEELLLDSDPNKKDEDGNYRIKDEKLRKSLAVGGKEWKKLINKYRIPFYWTTGTPGNCLIPIPYWLIGTMKGGKIYHQETGEKIGDLLGKGDLVALPVGSDKNRQLVITEWGRKLVKKYGTEGIFNKQLLTGNIEERVEGILNGVGLSLNKEKVQKLRNRKTPMIREYLVKKKVENEGERSVVELSILGMRETGLEHLWKAFYLDQKTKQQGYFLVNDYHREREFDNLDAGRVLNVCMVQGYKHPFLSRILPP